jgi:protein-ribulosamine 3-kinase
LPIPDSLRVELGIDDAAPASGGCIHDCYRVAIGGERRFLKTNAARHADAFAAEADGLHALSMVGMRTPKAVCTGVAGGRAYLLLEFLELNAKQDFAALGRMLATAHRKAGPRLGWARDNYIGATPQQNGWCDEWAEFWMERRMRPQLELARKNGFDVALPSLKLLDRHKPQPSLLHGDLWGGNAGFTAEGPVVFDPAVYYGDREADLAMTELFGGFPQAFYNSYNKTWPLDEGYERRKHLYNLYHLLNHLNLFGGGYLGQVKATLGLLLLR